VEGEEEQAKLCQSRLQERPSVALALGRESGKGALGGNVKMHHGLCLALSTCFFGSSALVALASLDQG
jgi:transketolase N-terminal domain/subunit